MFYYAWFNGKFVVRIESGGLCRPGNSVVKIRSACPLHGKTGYSGLNSNGKIHSGERGNAFRGITFFRFNRNFREFPYHLPVTQTPLRQHFREEMQDGDLCRCRPFMALKDVSFRRHCWLSVFLQHRCGTTGENDLRFDPFIFLLLSYY